MRVVLVAIAAALLAAAPCAAAQARPSYGILLLAHGGDEAWNANIAATGKVLDAQAPTEIALGMADVPAMQAAADKLEARGVAKIVAVPLFVHSRSEVLDQTRYALGLREKPSEVLRQALAAMASAHAHMRHAAGAMPHMMAFSTATVHLTVPLVMTPALDDSEAVARVLAARAKALSREPAAETVVLVAHGPVDEKANEAWLATMRTQAARVKKSGAYRAAVALTIRDDARPEVKGPALEALRRAVRRADENGGRALVVPYLISRGGIEGHISEALQGLDYAWDGRTLCPDPAIDAWAAAAAKKRGEAPASKSGR